MQSAEAKPAFQTIQFPEPIKHAAQTRPTRRVVRHSPRSAYSHSRRSPAASACQKDGCVITQPGVHRESVP